MNQTKDENIKNKCCEQCSCEDCQCGDGVSCDCEGCECGKTDLGRADGHLIQLEERVRSLEDQLKRAVADYQNLEKRVAEGRSELSSWATTELLKKMLPILDHLEKAVSGMDEEDKKSGWAKGVEMAILEFKHVLKSEGLEEIEVSGDFNPSLHEAVDSQEGENDKVLAVLEKGYRINNKVVKAAKVIVGRKSNEGSKEEK